MSVKVALTRQRSEERTGDPRAMATGQGVPQHCSTCDNLCGEVQKEMKAKKIPTHPAGKKVKLKA